MLKKTATVLFLLVTFATVCNAELFKGKYFSIELPQGISSSMIQIRDGQIGKIESWKYEGTYKKEKDVVCYSIEVVKSWDMHFAPKSNHEVAKEVLEFLFSASGTLGEVQYDAELDMSYFNAKAVGLELQHTGQIGTFRSRVIVDLPYIWTLNAASVNKTESEMVIINRMFRSFKIYNPNNDI